MQNRNLLGLKGNFEIDNNDNDGACNRSHSPKARILTSSIDYIGAEDKINSKVGY
jgi:hypothetical protein